MNLYEISATLPNGAVHKTKVYEINQERASNKGFKFALQFDASGKTTFTTTLNPEKCRGFQRYGTGFPERDQGNSGRSGLEQLLLNGL